MYNVKLTKEEKELIQSALYLFKDKMRDLADTSIKIAQIFREQGDIKEAARATETANRHGEYSNRAHELFIKLALM